MKPILLSMLALALTGAPALASDVGSCAADQTVVQAEVLPSGRVIAIAGLPTDTVPGDGVITPARPARTAYASLGAPPTAYPVCRTHAQDRCRVPGQGLQQASVQRAGQPAG